MLGQLVNREAPIQQHAFITINIGDFGFAARRRGEARIISKHAGLGIELADINNARTYRAVLDGQFEGMIGNFQRDGVGHALAFLNGAGETAIIGCRRVIDT